ncbi:hypothetical protein B7P43_G17336 [Cryptotermes secundus]|uniref:Endonuclease/exonuclease/phosphatase domain-containing protein n=1 Tax=Cryptotermes secundus TaxID=105785 RepID=A0A2J7REI8_9NEOP|nr:hypothetical protein B7P43_G17336 [Cryptotermes secundus]
MRFYTWNVRSMYWAGWLRAVTEEILKYKLDLVGVNQFDHILIYRRRHSSILNVRSFKAADCDTDHYLVVAEVRERLAVSKQGTYS